MADQRLQAVYDAASFLFIKKGYASTQVSQIAERANIATGSIYNLFSGKKSILHFVLLCTFEKDYLDGDVTLPVKEVADEVFIQHLDQIFGAAFAQIEERTNDGEPVQSFAEMLATLFDYGANYQVAFNIINDNRPALEKVEDRYRIYVNRTYEVIKANLLHYIEQGEVRKIELPELHIRNIIEGITWWSMYLPYQAPESKIPVSKAKEIALDILKHAYLKKPE